MNTIKTSKLIIFLKERLGGIFLLLLAGIIITGISFDFSKAESKNDPVATNNNDSSSFNEEQILGIEEKNYNSESVTLNENPGNNNNIQNIETDKKSGKQQNDEDAYYDELKSHLKKYCDTNFNAKKCHDYLVDAKESKNNGSRFKDLYKKYHFEKKEEKKSSVDSGNVEEDKIQLIVTSDGDSKSYEISASSEISVIDLMDLIQKDKSQNFSYYNFSGFVDKINRTENQGNMSWMLYLCKNSTCKLSSVGASDCKINGWDKIEWRYLDWTTVDWTTW